MPLENLEMSERTGLILRSIILSSDADSSCALLSTLQSIFRSRAVLELENLALRHQIGVLQRSARRRPKLTTGDRLLWVCLSRLWRDWRSALAIVKPETVVAWHRAGFRPFWTWKVRRGQPGRPVISRVPGSYPQDVPGEPWLGRASHPRRAAQTRHRHRREQRQQIHGALPQTSGPLPKFCFLVTRQ